MARYRQIPEHVDARQFTGGRENAEALITWLKSKGCEATWIDNQTVMDIHLVERLSFSQKVEPHETKIIRSAYRQDWIVLKDNRWRIFSERKFRERFEKI
ncbi:hypothetical protein QCN32_gp61 [Arthrobacter phage Niktson]|uniref:Uncharacterized protein n=2 Tax=Gordonvirus TaxID=1982152 RepID=A0A218M5N8_9CAUD|nr:hypothetical protein QCN31_gp62 [Arthrobacter phage Teacup]YP_010749891.1 hypothetical protein QCN32_gp61 [Arthrobacter phage Niktson]ASD52283.1 hypothetical protein NIKTSON_61 [Arthrobacter phage Niktson]ASD52377.1 hypothetical protein ELEPHANTMAN_61 [Arthrobacter phage ElephantMan]ASR84062.1 hypothetical protein SEA_TEACUP_62 [Arthrobacter phage Teacup]